jgi:hypothetical protein
MLQNSELNPHFESFGQAPDKVAWVESMREYLYLWDIKIDNLIEAWSERRHQVQRGCRPFRQWVRRS